jgi:MFS family permease
MNIDRSVFPKTGEQALVQTRSSSRSPIFYGWVVVATASLGLFFSGAPIVVYSFGVFLKPLTQEFHVGRGAISLAFTIHNFVGAGCAPFAGRLVDRLGAKRVIPPGLVLLGLILMSALLIGSRLWQLYMFYVLLAPVTLATTPIPYCTVIARWFDRRRGLALGLIMLGMGVGTVLMPPAVQQLIARFGWRMAFAIVGCAILVIPVAVVAVFLKDDPRQMGLLPDGVESRQNDPKNPENKSGLEWSEVYRTRTFWLMVSAFVLAGGSMHACILHMPALLGDRGLTAEKAALGSSIVGMAVIAGRLLSGYLQDRIFAPRVALAIFGMSAIGVALLWAGGGGAVALTAAFLVGLGMGAEVDIIAFLVSRYFGLRAFGTAFGFAFGSFIMAGGLGGMLMGAGFDFTGSYQVPLACFFVMTLLALVLFTQLGPYRFAAAHSEKRPIVGSESAA